MLATGLRMIGGEEAAVAPEGKGVVITHVGSGGL